MGAGTVSQDGKSIVTNTGVGIPRFCCGAIFGGRSGAGNTQAHGPFHRAAFVGMR